MYIDPQKYLHVGTFNFFIDLGEHVHVVSEA